MLHVIYNKETGETLRARARSVGCYINNYKTESAAKAALTRLDKKGLLGQKVIISGLGSNGQGEVIKHYVKDDFKVADVDTFRDEFPIKMVDRVNLMSGKNYLEYENTPNYCSPASEAYWSM